MSAASWGENNTLDIGSGHVLHRVTGPNGSVAGFTDVHPYKPDPAKECMGYVQIEGGDYSTNADAWKVESWDPLTLSPSLLCLTCGEHGFIREGTWVPA